MSQWTHIVATLDVETYIEDVNIKDRVSEMLERAPRITGSEQNADVFINVLNGYNVHADDCRDCKYKNTIIVHENNSFSCEAEEGYECPEYEYQTRVVITVVGDLRDRDKKTTGKEYKKFVDFIKKDCDFIVENQTVKIIDDNDLCKMIYK